MLPRPAWLAAGVVAAAAATQFIGCVAAATAVSGVVAAALGAEWLGRRRAAQLLAVVALGAALVVARVALAGGAGGGGALLVAPGGSDGGGAAAAPLPGESGTWRARVASVHSSRGQQIVTLAVEAPPLTCSANLPAFPPLAAGDTVAWSGRFRPLTNSDYDRWLASQSIAARCEADEVALEAHDESPGGWLERLRQASGDALERVLPEPEGGLSAAILVGLRDRVDRSVAADFTAAGVSHIVAISGWNIAIVAATVAALVRGRLSRRGRTVVTAAAIVAYTLFAGTSPSVVRAAVMAGAALLAVESGRGTRVSVTLAWAIALMLLADPATVSDAGFQLSAAATAGLVAWASPLTHRLGSAAPWLPGSIRECLGVSLAAQAATLPIALATFGRLAPIAPLANLVAVPLVPPAMAAGAVAFGAGLVGVVGAPGWLTGLVAMPAWALLAVLIGLVHAVASIPGANVTLPCPANLGAAAGAGLMLVWVHSQLRGARGTAASRTYRRSPADQAHAHKPDSRPRSGAPSKPRIDRRLAAALAGLVVMSGLVIAARPDGAVHVIVLDVGQGDAILVEGDRGSRMLVDGGPDGAALVRALDEFVPAWDRRLDVIALTHPHDDHSIGLAEAVRRYRVGRVFESGRPSDAPGYRALVDAVAGEGMELDRLRAGNSIRLDGCLLRVLWPDDGTIRPAELDPNATDNRKTNDASVVLLGEFESRRFLLMGDTEDDVDPILLARGLPHVDLLKVAHHGSATATSGALLEAIRPAVAVVSVGADNTYGHPAPSTMTRLRASSGRVLRTDQDGSVEVTLDATGVRVAPNRQVTDRQAADRQASDGVRFGGGAGLGSAGPGRSGLGGPVWTPARAETGGGRARLPLLYDSADVRPQPNRQRISPAFARSAGLALAPLLRRGGGGRLAGAPGRGSGALPRSPPRRVRRAPP